MKLVRSYSTGCVNRIPFKGRIAELTAEVSAVPFYEKMQEPVERLEQAPVEKHECRGIC